MKQSVCIGSYLLLVSKMRENEEKLNGPAALILYAPPVRGN